MASVTQEETHRHERAVEVIVRSPAGTPHQFRFGLGELWAQAAAAAISYFVDKQEIEPGDYALEVVRDGVATPIADTARLGDYELRDGDELHLVAEKPQVDG